MLPLASPQWDTIDYSIWAARNYGLRLIIPLTGTLETFFSPLHSDSSQLTPMSIFADNYAYCELPPPAAFSAPKFN